MSQSFFGEHDLSIEVIILLILGVFMFIFGVLLFSIHTGDLPYTPDSMYGLLLVIVSLQVITMGKTPFGDLRRSWLVVLIGIGTAALGMTACFIPGFLTDVVRFVVGILLFIGGIALLFQLCVAEGKAKAWVKSPANVRKLIIGCALAYLIAIILGAVTLLPGIISDPQVASLLILYGISLFYLSWCIQGVNRMYPPEGRSLQEGV